MKRLNEIKIPEDKNFNDFLVRDEQARIDNLRKYYSEIKPLIQKLKESARRRSSAQIAAIKILAEIASELTFLIETLYLSSSTKKLVEDTALSMRFFATTVDFNIPSKIKTTKLTRLSKGDITRIGLTELWQRKTRLKSTTKTQFDDLRFSLEGFIKAVVFPTSTGDYFYDTVKTQGNEFDVLNFGFECSGLVAVQPEVRSILTLPENTLDHKLWAASYVNWYKDLHPWPFLDSKGNERKLKPGEELKNPLHLYAYQKWLVRLKSSKSEHNPWLGLEIAVQKRLKESF